MKPVAAAKLESGSGRQPGPRTRWLTWVPVASAAYVGAAVWLAGWPDRGDLSLVGWSVLLALAVYLLDRVKLRDRDFDPADAEADPVRAAWERRHAVGLRAAASAAAVGALGWGLLTSPALVAVVGAALLGGAVYGSIPRRWRLKDHFLVKNLAVGGSIAALAGVVGLRRGGWPPSGHDLLVLLGLALLVSADAVASDIDDTTSDRRYGTHTVASVFGPRQGWWVFAGLGGVAAAVWVAAGSTVPAVALLATTASLVWWRPAPARLWIDLRLVAIAVASACVTLG